MAKTIDDMIADAMRTGEFNHLSIGPVTEPGQRRVKSWLASCRAISTPGVLVETRSDPVEALRAVLRAAAECRAPKAPKVPAKAAYDVLDEV